MGQHTRRAIPAWPYREAFPDIEIHDVIRAWRAGRLCRGWHDEAGRIVGHIRLTNFSRDRLIFEQRFFGTPNIEASHETVSLNIVEQRANELYDKPHFSCNTCTKLKAVIHYMEGQWARKDCHNIVYLTQRVPKSLRKVRLRDHIVDELAREPHARTRVYINESRRLARINRELDEAGVSELPEQLRFRSIAKWLEPDEHPQGSASLSGAYGWQRGDRGGLAWFQAAGGALQRPATRSKMLRSNTPESCQLIGVVLFTETPERLLGRFTTGFLPPLSRGQALAVLRAQWAQNPSMALHLRDDRPIPVERNGPDGQRELVLDLPYTGDARLWPLGGVPNPNTIMIKAQHPDDGVLRLVVRFQPDQLDAGKDLLAAAFQRITVELANQIVLFQREP